MGRRKWLRGLGLAAMLAGAGVANADVQWTRPIETSQEVTTPILTTQGGQPRPTPSGTVTFTLRDAGPTLSFTATIFNIDVTGSQTADINDNLLNAHIHAGGTAPPGNNGVVWGFIGTPFHDNNPGNTVVTPFGSGGVGGTITGVWDAPEGVAGGLAGQLNNIFANRAYINFHTQQNGGGEIRGQFPEPGAASLALLGAMGVLARRRRANNA